MVICKMHSGQMKTKRIFNSQALICNPKKAQMKAKKSDIFSLHLSDRGQMKIQQMAFMLLAVTLFFVLVGLFFLSFQLTRVQNQFTNIQEENAKKIVSTLANSPEFSCTRKRAHCIDFDKALVMQEHGEYKNFWQVQSISLKKLYPQSNSSVLCNKGNYPDCTELRVLSSSGKNLVPEQSNFVQICRREQGFSDSYEYCELGVLIVGFDQNE